MQDMVDIEDIDLRERYKRYISDCKEIKSIGCVFEECEKLNRI